MHRPHHRDGYVLLMTLVLILLAGLLLAGVARHSLLLAMESFEAQDDLQRRWGATSCELALLPRADEILRSLDAERATEAVAGRTGPKRLPDTARLTITLALGEMTFDLLLADEDAKVNVNALDRLASEPDAARLVRELSQSSSEAPKVLLRPYAELASNGPHAPIVPVEARFSSWGQVFALDQVQAGSSVPQGVAAATSDLTCWGSGKLNWCRASSDALECVGRLAAGSDAARRLSQLRGQGQDQKLGELLNLLQLNHEQRGRLQELLTDRSSCYSLWLRASRSTQLVGSSALRRSGGRRPPVGGTTNDRTWQEFCVAVHEPRGESTSPDSDASQVQTDSARSIRLSRFMW